MTNAQSKEPILDFLYRSMQELSVIIHVVDDFHQRYGAGDGDVASGMSYILRDIRDRMGDQIHEFERDYSAAEAAARTRRVG